MPGVVERRTQQIVHRRVDDREIARRAGLQVRDARQQHARIADEAAARLEQQPLAPAVEQRAHHRGVVVDADRRLVAIADAEAAAEVDVVQRDALGRERIDERQHLAPPLRGTGRAR